MTSFLTRAIVFYMDNNILNLIEKRKEQLNIAISVAMMIDLLDDVISDLRAFQNVEQIQEAIKFLENTKRELNPSKPAS